MSQYRIKRELFNKTWPGEDFGFFNAPSLFEPIPEAELPPEVGSKWKQEREGWGGQNYTFHAVVMDVVGGHVYYRYYTSTMTPAEIAEEVWDEDVDDMASFRKQWTKEENDGDS